MGIDEVGLGRPQALDVGLGVGPRKQRDEVASRGVVRPESGHQRPVSEDFVPEVGDVVELPHHGQPRGLAIAGGGEGVADLEVGVPKQRFRGDHLARSAEPASGYD